MTNVDISRIVTRHRFPESDLRIIGLVFYAPFGIFLLFLRLLLALSTLLVARLFDIPAGHKIARKIQGYILGILVQVENPDKVENVDVYVTNCRSIFDFLVVNSVVDTFSPTDQCSPFVLRCLGLKYSHDHRSPGFTDFMLNDLANRKSAFHFAPEHKCTSGNALLKFRTYPFGLSNRVQPICICIERPLLDLAPTVLGANFWADVMYFLFSPVTIYKLRFLPSVEKGDKNEVEFCEVVRKNVATALKIETTSYGVCDLLEWEKRQSRENEERRRVIEASHRLDGETRRMVSQVKDVLPHVPSHIILREIRRNRNVDATITNILEGRISFTPEGLTEIRMPEPSSASSNVSANTDSDSQVGTISSAAMTSSTSQTFSKSTHERTMSFKQRKEQMIANARQRYIEQHKIQL